MVIIAAIIVTALVGIVILSLWDLIIGLTK
jgi:hypothetical protein